LKFKHLEKASVPLGESIAEALQASAVRTADHIVVPIPLSSRRKRTRGFNQSEHIGRIVARRLDLAIAEELLVRTRHTQPQSGIRSMNDRLKNVSRAFSLINTGEVRGKKILLIDDVRTSGATLLEASRTLKAGGARSIIAYVATDAHPKAYATNALHRISWYNSSYGRH